MAPSRHSGAWSKVLGRRCSFVVHDESSTAIGSRAKAHALALRDDVASSTMVLVNHAPEGTKVDYLSLALMRVAEWVRRSRHSEVTAA